MPGKIFVSISSVVALCMAMLTVENAQANPRKTTVKSSAHSRPKAVAATPSAPKPLLDTLAVRKLYLDGDFDEAIGILETGMREKRPFNHTDSVFIFKHLGVMYAAKYDTREKGKYYMHQLLMAEPTAKIMDMYASDMIYMIFKNIQDEFESTRGRMDRAETHVRQNALPEPKQVTTGTSDPKASSSSNTHAWVWVGTTTAVVAAGVGAYFMFSDEPKTVTQNHSFE